MDCIKSISLVVGGILLTVTLLIPSTAFAIERISMSRINPNQPITRDGILSKVETEYKGRLDTILSLDPRPSPSAPDCHVVKILTKTAEWVEIHVACN